MTKYPVRYFIYFTFSILVFEAAGHLFYGDRLRSDLWTQLDSDGLKHTPNFDGSFRNFEMSYRVRTNVDGFRDRLKLKELGPADWIAVGDSFTFGVGAELEELWLKHLGRKLGTNFYNAGVAGGNPKHYIKNYMRNLEEANHKGVIMGFHIATDFSSQKKQNLIKPIQEYDLLYYRWRTLVFLGSNSITYNVFRDIYYLIKGGRKSGLEPQMSSTQLPQELISYNCKLITDFAKYLQSKHKKFLFAFIPEAEIILRGINEKNIYAEAVRDFEICLQKARIDFANPNNKLHLLPLVKRKKLFYEVDKHLSRTGNKMFGDFLFHFGINAAAF